MPCAPRISSSLLALCLSAGLFRCAAADETQSRSSRCAVACGPDAPRRSIRLENEGGQTGGEGSCALPDLPEPFTAADVQALVEGRHVTSLAYRPAAQTDLDFAAERGQRMQVDVVVLGESEAHYECDRPVLRLEVRLRFDEPALDLVFETVLTGFTKDSAPLRVQLPPAVAAEIGLEEARGGSKPATLMLWFGPDGVRGSVTYSCGRMVFPEGRRCTHVGAIERALSSDGSAALRRLDAVRDVPFRWEDGSSTTLTLALEQGPEFICSDAYPFALPSRTQENLHVQIRLTTADGRADLVLPAVVSFREPDESGLGRFRVESGAIVPKTALDGAAHLDLPRGPDDGFELFFSFEDIVGEPSLISFRSAPLTPNALGAGLTTIVDTRETGKDPTCFGQSAEATGGTD